MAWLAKTLVSLASWQPKNGVYWWNFGNQRVKNQMNQILQGTANDKRCQRRIYKTSPNKAKQLSTAVSILLYRFLSCWCLETFFHVYVVSALQSIVNQIKLSTKILASGESARNGMKTRRNPSDWLLRAAEWLHKKSECCIHVLCYRERMVT